MSENRNFSRGDAFRDLQHPLQRRRLWLALPLALLLFPLIGLGLAIGSVFLVVPFVALMLWLSGRILYANFLGNNIQVSDLNYPRIYAIGEELKALMGYAKPVSIFVLQENAFNAYLLKFFFYRKAVFLPVEILQSGVTDHEVRWLVGRFVGYLRARDLAGFWGWTIRAAQHLLVFNVFLLPYERALVYTGDRLALAAINGDITSAVSVMQKLFVGRELGYSVNPAGIIGQQAQVKGSLFAFLARLPSGFPHQTTRYVDLIWCASQRYPTQYARFVAENPGLPGDLWRLSGLARPPKEVRPALAERQSPAGLIPQAPTDL